MPAPTAWAAWAALPNAHHIDRIFADLKARPEVWAAAWAAAWGAARARVAWDAAQAATWDAAQAATWDAAREATWDAARAAAWDAAWAAAWGAARDATWDAAREAAWAAAWDAAWALVAWDDVAYILTLPPDAVQMLIETCTDHHKHAAVLLLPACVAFNSNIERI